MKPSSTTRLTAAWNSAEPSATHGQDLERKHDLLDVVCVGENQPRRAVITSANKLEDDEAGEQDDGELAGRLPCSALAAAPPPRLKTTPNTNV